jgi:hypothetical protein
MTRKLSSRLKTFINESATTGDVSLTPSPLTQQPQAVVEPPQRVDTAPTSVSTKAPISEDSVETSVEEPRSTSLFDKPKADSVREYNNHPETITPDISDEEIEAHSKAESIREDYRSLAKAHRVMKKTYKEKLAELEAMQEEISKYKTGAVMPDKIQELSQEVARLKTYEQVVDLKSSREYQEKFLEPLNTSISEIVAYGKEYNIPENIMQKAVDITNEAELNSFLSDHFDDIGALEVKQKIKQARQLKKSAVDAEKNPTATIETLRQQRIEREQAEKQAALNRAVSITETSWQDAVNEIQMSKNIPELTYREGDVEHNEKVVAPIMSQASADYAKVVKALIEEGGLKEMPAQLAKVISKMMLLAHSSSIAINSRDQAVDYAGRVVQDAQKINALVRPSLGKTAGNATVGNPAGPKQYTPVKDRVGSFLAGIRGS